MVAADGGSGRRRQIKRRRHDESVGGWLIVCCELLANPQFGGLLLCPHHTNTTYYHHHHSPQQTISLHRYYQPESAAFTLSSENYSYTTVNSLWHNGRGEPILNRPWYLQVPGKAGVPVARKAAIGGMEGATRGFQKAHGRNFSRYSCKSHRRGGEEDCILTNRHAQGANKSDWRF